MNDLLRIEYSIVTGLYLAPDASVAPFRSLARLSNWRIRRGCKAGRSKPRPITVLINPRPLPSFTRRHAICTHNLIRLTHDCPNAATLGWLNVRSLRNKPNFITDYYPWKWRGYSLSVFRIEAHREIHCNPNTTSHGCPEHWDLVTLASRSSCYQEKAVCRLVCVVRLIHSCAWMVRTLEYIEDAVGIHVMSYLHCNASLDSSITLLDQDHSSLTTACFIMEV